MRPKNFNFIEKYVEKVILSVAALFFLLVGWFYFLGDPYVVTLKLGRQDMTLKPSEIESQLLSKVQSLRLSISAPENPLPELKIPDYVDNFRRRATSPALTVGTFEIPLAELGLDEKIVLPPAQQQPLYAVPQPPPPVRLLTSRGYAVLAEPQDPATLPAYTQRIGDQTPRDFRWVTVGADFDLAAWRERLRQGGEAGTDMVPLPPEWWRGKMLMVHAVLQRQKRDLRTGEWGPIEEIAPLPNASVDFPPENRRFVQSETRDLLDKLQLEQRSIARPEFLPLASGAWTRPGGPAGVELTPEQQRDLANANRDLSDVTMQIARLEQQLAQAMRGGERAGPAVERQRKSLQEQLNVQRQRLADIQKRVSELTGVDRPAGAAPQPGPEVAPGPPTMPPVGPPAGAVAPPPPPPTVAAAPAPMADTGMGDSLASDDRISLWRHDVGVEPGAEYRYRLRVHMLNPLFQRAQLRREQQTEHYHRKELESEYSEWSEPVVIEPEFYYFVVAASRQQGVADVEVYRVFDGRWRRQLFSVRPGDPVGGMVNIRMGDREQPLNMRVEALVVDVEYEVPLAGSNLNARTAKVVLYDERQGQLQERTVEADKQNPARIRLQNLSQGPTVASQ